MNTPIKVFIIDDSLLIREGIKRVISPLKFISLVGETHELNHIKDQLSLKQPDILLLEMDLCQRPMKELIAEIKVASPTTQVLIISDCQCELPVLMAIRSGISGYLKKNVSADELVKAIKTIASGQAYFTPDISELLAKGVLLSASGNLNFSDREMEILRLICKGRSNEQMADLLFITEKTVITHRKNIMNKAGVKKSSDLIVWAFDNNLVSR